VVHKRLIVTSQDQALVPVPLSLFPLSISRPVLHLFFLYAPTLPARFPLPPVECSTARQMTCHGSSSTLSLIRPILRLTPHTIPPTSVQGFDERKSAETRPRSGFHTFAAPALQLRKYATFTELPPHARDQYQIPLPPGNIPADTLQDQNKPKAASKPDSNPYRTAPLAEADNIPTTTSSGEALRDLTKEHRPHDDSESNTALASASASTTPEHNTVGNIHQPQGPPSLGSASELSDATKGDPPLGRNKTIFTEKKWTSAIPIFPLIPQRKPFEKETFQEMRTRHRSNALATSHTPRSSRESTTAELQNPHWIKPDADPLRSRYDWRLRAPSRSPVQKSIYGQRKVWKKSRPIASQADVAGLAAYQSHFQRFIDLEREEAERAALARLKANVSNPQGAQYLQTGTKRDRLDGLQARPAKVKQNFTPASDVTIDSRDVEVEAGDGGPRLIDPFDVSAHEASAASETRNQPRIEDEKLVYFSLPRGGNLPENDFAIGKMVFIWECTWHDLRQMFYVPKLDDPNTTWQDLAASPSRGYVERVFANSIHVKCHSSFRPDPNVTYRYGFIA